MKTDQPRTDALREAIDNGQAAEAEMTCLAGKLERERDEARNLADSAMWEADRLRSKLHTHLVKYDSLKRQWDEARSENVEE
jgi:hypothetical protein